MVSLRSVLSGTLLGAALVGSISSTVFLGLTLAGVRKFRRQAASQKRKERASGNWPAVSILKPLHGIEPQLAKNLDSFFNQDYAGRFEVILAVDQPEDPALPIARAICEKHANIPSKLLVTGEPLWPNPPAYSFARMAGVAQHDILVTSDSDVEVDRHYLTSVVPPLTERGTGMVTCLYRGVNTGGLPSSLDAVGMSVEMTAGVLVANLLEGIKFGLGPTIAVRRDALEAIGGYASLGDYFSNDFVIGNFIAAKGFHIELSHYVVSHIVPPMTFKRMWQRQVRWATGTRYSRAKGHFGTVFVFAIPYGVLGLLSASILGRPVLGLVLFGGALINRLIECYAIGWGVARDRECLTRPWLYPLRDALGFAIWVASYLTRRMRWRTGRFELVEGGKIRVRGRVAVQEGSRAVESKP